MSFQKELHKEEKYYYPSGALRGIITWKGNVKHGKRTINYSCGAKFLECIFVNGKKEGPQNIYDKSGKIIESSFYRNGKPV